MCTQLCIIQPENITHPLSLITANWIWCHKWHLEDDQAILHDTHKHVGGVFTAAIKANVFWKKLESCLYPHLNDHSCTFVIVREDFPSSQAIILIMLINAFALKHLAGSSAIPFKPIHHRQRESTRYVSVHKILFPSILLVFCFYSEDETSA